MFWENFCKLCEKNVIKPNLVCKELKFSNATATKWEKESTTSGTTLSKIADYFSVSTDYLLTGAECEPSRASIQCIRRGYLIWNK